jgi:hypothetical protein
LHAAGSYRRSCRPFIAAPSTTGWIEAGT